MYDLKLALIKLTQIEIKFVPWAVLKNDMNKVILCYIIPGDDDVDCFLTVAVVDLVGEGSERFGVLTVAGLTGFMIVVIIIGNLFGCLCG